MTQMQKYIGVAVAVVVIMALWSLADIYLFEDGSILTSSTRSSDVVTRLEAQGEDLRVYEFTPETSPHKQCVFVAGNEGKGGLFCFNKETPVDPTLTR